MTTEAELLANLPADGVRVWRNVSDSTWIRAVLPDGEHWFTRGGAAWVECQWACNSSDPESSPDWTEIILAPTPSIRDQRIAEAWERWPDGRLFERETSTPGAPDLRVCLNGRCEFVVGDPVTVRWVEEQRSEADYYASPGGFWTELPRPTPALPDPSGDLPDGTRVRIVFEGPVKNWKRGRGSLETSGRGQLYFGLRDTDGATVEVLALPTPPPSALDGKPGSLWRDPETGGIYCRTDTGRANSNEPAFSLAGGNSWVRSASWLHTVHGRATAVIARLVPAQVADHG